MVYVSKCVTIPTNKAFFPLVDGYKIEYITTLHVTQHKTNKKFYHTPKQLFFLLELKFSMYKMVLKTEGTNCIFTYTLVWIMW